MSGASALAVELTADCATCGLEAGVVESYDAHVAACRFGVPANARCKLCAERREGVFDRAPARAMRDVPANRCPACLNELTAKALDEKRCATCGASAEARVVEPARALDGVDAFAAALDAWVERESWASRDALLAGVFCEPEIAALVARVARGEPLEVLGDPFANLGVRTVGHGAGRAGPSERGERAAPAAAARTRERPAAGSTELHASPQSSAVASIPTGAPVPAPPEPQVRSRPPSVHPPPPPTAPPRAIVYPLVSVIAADGEVHPAERALVDRFLHGEGLAPLSDDEFRVHRPDEVAALIPKERREDVVRLMCESATIDGMPDESERRVIRAYAAAWHVPDEKVELWLWGYENIQTSLVRQLWLKLRRFVLSARWADADDAG